MLKLYNISVEKWDIYMPLILFYYNTALSESLNGLTPFEALFLRPAKSPLSLNTKDKLKKSWAEQFGKVSENIFTDLAKNYKRRFNAQNLIKEDAPVTLKRNTKVLVYKPQPKGKSSKLFRKWDGPYRVQKKTSENVYLLVNLSTGRRIKRNLDLIRILPGKINPISNISPPIIPQNITSNSDTQNLENISSQNNAQNNIDLNQNLPVQSEPQGLTDSIQANPRQRKRKQPSYLKDYQVD